MHRIEIDFPDTTDETFDPVLLLVLSMAQTVADLSGTRVRVTDGTGVTWVYAKSQD